MAVKPPVSPVAVAITKEAVVVNSADAKSVLMPELHNSRAVSGESDFSVNVLKMYSGMLYDNMRKDWKLEEQNARIREFERNDQIRKESAEKAKYLEDMAAMWCTLKDQR